MTIREKITKALEWSENGRRAREIASDINHPVLETSYILHELEKEGFVKHKAVHDIGNMEYYDLWTLGRKGNKNA